MHRSKSSSLHGRIPIQKARPSQTTSFPTLMQRFALSPDSFRFHFDAVRRIPSSTKKQGSQAYTLPGYREKL
jgi:hypothetical protein